MKLSASFYRINFDLHRADGLWLWMMLFILARSSVYWNLNGFYAKTTQLFFDYEQPFIPSSPAGSTATGSRSMSAGKSCPIFATFLHALVSKDSNTPSQKGGDLLSAPRRVYNFNAHYAFVSGELKGLELGVSYFYASRTEATLPNTYGFTLVPQQMLGDSLAYNFTDNLKLEINATNLTNRPNWTSDGSMFCDEPRSVSASLIYKY